MKLDKTHNEFLRYISSKELSIENRISQVDAYCKGVGIDSKSYSSPVTTLNNKIAITYKKSLTYFF